MKNHGCSNLLKSDRHCCIQMCKNERRGRKKTGSKGKQKEEGKKRGYLLAILFQCPDFTEDDTLTGGYVTGPGSLNQLFAEVGLKCKSSVC